MKPSELYQLIEVFDKMFGDERFTKQARLAMGQEFIASLPPASLIKNSTNTHLAARNYMAAVMQGAINEQAKRIDESKVEKTSSKPTNQASVDRQEHGHASDKKDEGRGRRKVAKTPGTPENSGIKKSQA